MLIFMSPRSLLASAQYVCNVVVESQSHKMVASTHGPDV